MPRISAFYGIVIAMYYRDHAPPHFHAKYGGHAAQVLFDGRVLHGWLPRRAAALVRQWARLHQSELIDNWTRAAAGERLVTIDPLP